jgi:hypothetical protein
MSSGKDTPESVQENISLPLSGDQGRISVPASIFNMSGSAILESKLVYWGQGLNVCGSGGLSVLEPQGPAVGLTLENDQGPIPSQVLEEPVVLLLPTGSLSSVERGAGRVACPIGEPTIVEVICGVPFGGAPRPRLSVQCDGVATEVNVTCPATPVCLFFNTSSNSWSDSGLVTGATVTGSTNQTACYASHLTEFSGEAHGPSLSPPRQDLTTCCLLVDVRMPVFLFAGTHAMQVVSYSKDPAFIRRSAGVLILLALVHLGCLAHLIYLQIRPQRDNKFWADDVREMRFFKEARQWLYGKAHNEKVVPQPLLTEGEVKTLYAFKPEETPHVISKIVGHRLRKLDGLASSSLAGLWWNRLRMTSNLTLSVDLTRLSNSQMTLASVIQTVTGLFLAAFLHGAGTKTSISDVFDGGITWSFFLTTLSQSCQRAIITATVREFIAAIFYGEFHF